MPLLHFLQDLYFLPRWLAYGCVNYFYVYITRLTCAVAAACFPGRVKVEKLNPHRRVLQFVNVSPLPAGPRRRGLARWLTILHRTKYTQQWLTGTSRPPPIVTISLRSINLHGNAEPHRIRQGLPSCTSQHCNLTSNIKTPTNVIRYFWYQISKQYSNK